jgi:peptidyl-prolyl cis-trans isomerase D
VELDYIELSAQQYLQRVEEDLVLEAYQLEIDSNQYQTEHRVSHILFEQGADESQEQLMARVAAAQASLDAGAEFDEVAREYSNDIGSAGSGGDLGYTSGDAFPEEMEEAIALLQLNVVSAPVTTDAGIHLIKVTDRKEGDPPTLEEMRPQLEQQLALSEARVELLRTVEDLKDLAFNAADLNSPAAELELEVQRSEPVTRGQPDGLFANPSLLSAAFSEEVLGAGHNSDVIELGGDRFVVLRVHNHNMPEVKPLPEVEAQIAAILAENAARAEVTAAAERASEAVLAGASIEEVANEAGYNWQVELAADRRNTTLPPEVLQRAFSLPEPAQNAPVVDVVLSAFGDARVIALQSVNKGRWDELEEASRLALQRRLTTEYADLLDREYQQGLRDSADISVM